MRGRKFDFERWKSHGVDGWEFEDVLETYKALENTQQLMTAGMDARGHFQFGSKQPRKTHCRSFVDAAIACGFRRVNDFNSAEREGVGFNPLNVLDGVRENTGIAYLPTAVRECPI